MFQLTSAMQCNAASGEEPIPKDVKLQMLQHIEFRSSSYGWVRLLSMVAWQFRRLDYLSIKTWLLSSSWENTNNPASQIQSSVPDPPRLILVVEQRGNAPHRMQ
jgi:hypothetical protein